MNEKADLCHLTDVLELCIDLREGTTFYIVSSGHDDSLPCFRTCTSSRDVTHFNKSTCLHQVFMDATNRGLIEVIHIGN